MKRKNLWILVCVLLILSSCNFFPFGGLQSKTVTPAKTAILAIDTAGPKIAFAATGWSVPGSSYEIFIMNPDGSNIQCVTNAAGDDREPAWSPDGKMIAFSSNRDGNYEIYVMNADGSKQTRLTNDPAWDGQPAWSPDGQWIAFTSYPSGSEFLANLYKMKPDGSAVTPLGNLEGMQKYPNWSPDGTHIIFSSFGGGTGRTGIYMMNADGTDIQQLTSTCDHYPAISPDGTKIAFDSCSSRSGGIGWDIYVMNADGSGITQITFFGGLWDKKPTWSPDGKQIIFWSTREGSGTFNIYVMSADGSGITKLTNPEYLVYSGPVEPVWKP